jgi:RNA polymerase sigma-70 factor (ECF subfamily)
MLNPTHPLAAPPPAGAVSGAAAAGVDGDAALVAAARSGDTAACHRIWSRYAPLVRRLVRGYFGPGAERDDLGQEVFLRVFSRLHELREPDALRGFIAGICLGVARNMSRRARVRSVLRLSSDEERPELAVPGIEDEARQVVRRLFRLLDAASAEDRSLFVARYVEKMEMNDIALAHRVSIGTAKRRVARMTQRMEAAMARDPVLAEHAARLFAKAPAKDDLMEGDER